MAKAKFEIKDEDIKKITELIKKVPQNAESTINNYLHNTGKDKIVKSITNFIPVSRNFKKHAKTSKWSKTDNFNLAVQISNVGKFYYLYFPLTGTGTSNNKNPNDFFTKGMDIVYDDVVSEMLNELENNILKGGK